MRNYSLKISRSLLECLCQFIEQLMKLPTTCAEDKLLLAAMAQVGSKLDVHLGTYRQLKKMYSIKLTPTEAQAMIVLANNHVTDPANYLDSQLILISASIEQFYQ